MRPSMITLLSRILLPDLRRSGDPATVPKVSELRIANGTKKPASASVISGFHHQR